MSKIVFDQLFNPALQREIPLSLVGNLNGIDVLGSVSPPQVTPGQVISVPKIYPSVVYAVSKIADILYKGMGGFGCGKIAETNADMYMLEMKDRDETHVAVIAPRGDRQVIKVCRFTSSGTYMPYTVSAKAQNGALLIAIYLLWQRMKNLYTPVKTALDLLADGGLKAEDVTKFAQACAEISRDIRVECLVDSPTIAFLNEQGNTYRLFEGGIREGKYRPQRVQMGKFSFLNNEADVTTPRREASIKKSARQWTEEERLLIPTIEPWYVVPEEVGLICNLIQKSTNTFKPKRNFMLRGPSSTGKTSMARAIAATLGMPYVFITCSADTESYAFLGQPMYDCEGKVKYVESDFIRAIKNGWVVEVQEPYVIAKQGVLTALNGLLDDTAGITLPTGEFVKRHQDAIVIFTTNVSYVGCKKPNQSVLRRMNNVFDINLPSDKDIKARVQAVTKFGNDALLSKMVAAMHKINRYLQEQCITDGVCGVSELIDWVQTIQFAGDVLESAESTIVSKATDDPEVQAGITSVLASMIGEQEYVSVDEEINRSISL